MAPAVRPPRPFVIDTREQLPYTFPNAVRAALPTGDYSVLGLEHLAVVERKSKADLYGCIGKSRARFVRELERMGSIIAAGGHAALVIECSEREFLNPPSHSLVHPRQAIGSVIAWAVRYHIQVWFCDDRFHAEATTRKFLENCVEQVHLHHHRLFTGTEGSNGR